MNTSGQRVRSHEEINKSILMVGELIELIVNLSKLRFIESSLSVSFSEEVQCCPVRVDSGVYIS